MAPRWHKEGPRRPQDSPKRAQDEAKMAQHGASDLKLKPKGRKIKNLQKPMEKQCFLRVRGPQGGPQRGQDGFKLPLSWAMMS